MKNKIKKMSPFFTMRSKKAEERFNKTHELHKMGLKANQIRLVLADMGHKKPSQPTVVSYLQHKTYPEYSAFHKNRIATAKAKRQTKLEAKATKKPKVVVKPEAKVEIVNPIVDHVEASRKFVSTEAMELNRINLIKAEDLMAEALEIIKRIKWGLK